MYNKYDEAVAEVKARRRMGAGKKGDQKQYGPLKVVPKNKRAKGAPEKKHRARWGSPNEAVNNSPMGAAVEKGFLKAMGMTK